MKPATQTVLFTALTWIALAISDRALAQNADELGLRRAGPVELPATLRPPFATEIRQPKGAQAFLLPGLSYDTSFPCLKWFPQGPGLTTNGDLNISAQAHPTSGGVSAIAPHPTNPNILYIGTVNGGVWRSDNATSNYVVWTPLTDDQLSLSIGGLAMDPTDATGQTLVAGIGRRSSFGGTGGAQIGLLRTTNGGATWTQLGAAALAGRNIYNLHARGGTILLAVVSTDNGTAPGLYRTSDGGANFTNMSGFAGSGLPAGAVTHLAADPGNSTRFYAHVASTGVYRTDNSGATWVNVSAGIAAANVGQLTIAVFNGGGTNAVYAAELTGTSRVYRSANQGTNWTQMDSIQANTSSTFNSFVADPQNPNLVYLGGLFVRANFPYSGRIVRGDASQAAGGQWASIASTNGTGNGTAPHTDSRAMAFNSANALIEGDDGGVYGLPVANTGHNGLTSQWRSLNGNLADSEMHSIAYDRLAKIFIGGGQDIGFQEQVRTGTNFWNKTSNGDGGDAAVDVMSTPGRSIRYGSSQNLGGFYRATNDANNVQQGIAFPARTPLGGVPAMNGQFVNPIALNAVNPFRLLFGAANGVYESTNRGDTVIRLNTSTANSPAKMAYGGRIGTSTNADVIYVGVGSSVQVRTNAVNALAATPTAFPGGNVQSVVLNPADWRNAFVVGTTKVYSTANAGVGWIDLTGNLQGAGAGTFHSVEYLTLPGGDAIVVGTDLGAHIMRTATPGVWKTLGVNLPNAPVFDTQYDPLGNVLAVSTFGRGAWLYNFNSNFILTNVVTTLADSGPGSLRQALLDANADRCPTYITFAVSGTISVLSDLPYVTALAPLTILGPGTNSLTISGGNARRLLAFGSGTTNRVVGLTLANGFSVNHGAAIANTGRTVLENCLLRSNAVVNSFGGAVCNFPGGTLIATNCVFANNTIRGGTGESRPEGSTSGGGGGGGAGLGGAIFSDGPELTLQGCAFIGNVAAGGDGGNGGGNQSSDSRGGNGGFPNRGNGGSGVNVIGGAGGLGGGAGGGGRLAAGGVGGFGGGGGGGGASTGGGTGGAGGAGGTYAGTGGTAQFSFAGGGGGGAGLGGAVFVNNGLATIVNCAFTGNVATNGVGGSGSFGAGVGVNGQGVGGAIFNLNGSVCPVSTTFSGNIASTSLPDMDFTTQVSNVNDSGPGSLRQAICNANAHAGNDTISFAPELSSVIIRLTTGQLDVADATGSLTLSGASVTGGLTISGEGLSRVFNVVAGASATLDSLTISNGNSFGDPGGGLLNQGSTILRRCTFVGNQTAQSGGAIRNLYFPASLMAENCTFFNNRAEFGGAGAILNDGGPTLTLRHCTIVSNRANAPGGGLWLFNGAVTLSHCLIASNAAPATGPDVFKTSSPVTSAFNLVQDGTGSGLANGVNGDLIGTAGAPINPQLGAFRSNGGNTFTLLPLGGSPAVDAGDPLFNGAGLTDQRGFVRLANGRVDIGAVEGGLRTFYAFDNFSRVDLGGASSLLFQGDGGEWSNSDHRGQGNSSVALNDFVGGVHYGTNNYYRLTTPHDPTNSNRGLGLQGDFTVSVWIWPRVIGGWKVVLGSTTTPGVPGTPVFGLLDNHAYAAFWGNDLPGGIPVAASQWNHLAWTYNSHGGQMALYVNGRLDNSAVGRTNTTLDANALLGFSAAIADSYFQGLIDEFAIFGEALSPSQITALAAPNGILPNTNLPAPVLSPGLDSGACAWNVREIYAHTNDPVQMPFDLPTAEHIANSPQPGNFTNYNSSVINRYDSKYNPPSNGFFGDDTLFASDNLTPQGLIDGDDNYFVLVARTTIQIAAEDDYTFGFATDDGARLRINGAAFSSSTRLDTGNPANPAHRGDTLSYPGNSGNSQTLGVTHLTSGNYEVEFLTWELGGGAFAEVFVAPGAKTSVDGSFSLLSPTLFRARPTLGLATVSPTQIRVTWSPTNPCDQLLSAPSLAGPWTAVPGVVSGQLLPTTNTMQFFRVVK